MTVVSSTPTRRRARVRVTGTVQGVGFRPYVFRLASELGLSGFVLNDAHGVLLEVEGSEAAVGEFLRRLGPEAPPLAVVERALAEELAPEGAGAFEIRASPRGELADAPVTPDSATCQDCLSELFDPWDRRHRYPFINCTNCGPRFTIVRGIPYDRPVYDDGAFPDVRALPARIRRSGRPALSRSAERLPPVRPGSGAARGGRKPRHGGRCARSRAGGGDCAAGRRDPGGEGNRRLSSGLPSRRPACGRHAAVAQAPRGQAICPDGRLARRGAHAGGARGPGAGAAARARASDRAGASRGRRGGRRCGGARGRRTGRDAAVLAPSPPAARRRGDDARDDQRERLG